MGVRTESPGTRAGRDAGHAPEIQVQPSARSHALARGQLGARAVPSPDLLALQRLTLQRSAEGSQPTGREDPAQVHAAALHGISGSGGPLPFLDIIQRSFGKHDVSAVRVHTDWAAAEGARAIGAAAYAVGNHIAFAIQPDLHTTAHEAAHVIQQRAGVNLPSGVGQVGDPYERHADAVADLVVRGQSAEALLDRRPG